MTQKETVKKLLEDTLAALQSMENSREKSLVVTKVQEAIHWLNEVK
jgi:aspartate oxidase